jgi:hypothetical protein
MNKRFVHLLLLCLAALVPAPVLHADDSVAYQFIDKYCIECHDSDTEEGDVNLEVFHDKRDLRQLFDVYDQTILEYMPPEDEKTQPTLQDRSDFVHVLEGMLAEKGHDPKIQPGFGNYVDHEALFTPRDVEPFTEKRAWRIDPSAMADIANHLIGQEVFRAYRQSVGKEHPSFTYRAPAHTFRDFASTSDFENTTTELALAYAKEIADYMEEYRFAPQVKRWEETLAMEDEKKREARLKIVSPPDRIGETYRLLFNREIPDEDRAQLEGLEERWAVAALILSPDSVFRMEIEMDDYELARTLGFTLNESGPDPQLYDDIAQRPLEEVLDERLQTPEFNWRLVRFMREYFEYDKAPDVFKDPEDQPPEVVKRQAQYRPLWHVEDADHFCLRIIEEDHDVLKQLLTSNRYSVKGGLNSLHIKINKRASRNGYIGGYHGIYGVTEDELPPWRADYDVPDRQGMLHHPAWLIAFSDNEKNQAIQRGRWINTKLLGSYVPDAPVEVDASLPTDPTLTLREKMHVTRETECWACHRRMDDFGLPFEQFDFLGHHRLLELDKPVVVTGNAMGMDIENPYAYVAHLAESKHVQQVFLRHLFRLFMGRNETLDDANTLIAMDKSYTPQGSIKAATKTLLLSNSYRLRK